MMRRLASIAEGTDEGRMLTSPFYPVTVSE